MSDFASMCHAAAAELGVDGDRDQLAAFLVGAQWSLDRIIALETALDTKAPSDGEVRAGAEALLIAEAGQDWYESTPTQRHEYAERARTVIQACIDLHNTKEDHE